MKQNILSTLKQLTSHKRLLWLLVMLVILGLAVTVFISLTIESSELRIVTHYTAYGSTHFYRDQWMYLIAFALFTVLTVVLGVGVALKLLRQDRETLALLYGWVSVGLLLMTLVTYIHLIAHKV